MKRASLALVLALFAGPLLLVVLGSIGGEGLLLGGRAADAPTLAHYQSVIFGRGFLRAALNSLVAALATTLFCLLFGALAAYALARLRPIGGRAILALVLLISLFPPVAILSPLFLLLRGLGLLDQPLGLVLPYLAFALPLTLWTLTGFFKELPVELEEAALVDGASRARVLFLVVLPLSWPALAAAGVLCFAWCWNELLFALAFTVRPEHQTLPVALTLLRGRHEVPWGDVMAAACLTTIPVALLVLAFQRRITAGITAGATKG